MAIRRADFPDHFAEMMWMWCRTMMSVGYGRRSALRIALLAYTDALTHQVHEIEGAPVKEFIEREQEEFPKHRETTAPENRVTVEMLSLTMPEIGRLLTRYDYIPKDRNRIAAIFIGMMRTLLAEERHMRSVQRHIMREEIEE